MAKERVGYALGYGKFTNVREMAEVMKQAEERGFEMAFFSETIELMRDSVSSLAAIGLATKNLKLGTTQIVRLRGPVVMAQSLATLDELTGGRMTIAPGACTKEPRARSRAAPRRRRDAAGSAERICRVHALAACTARNVPTMANTSILITSVWVGSRFERIFRFICRRRRRRV